MTADDQGFVWATGIEDTFVTHVRARGRALDEYELMGHYKHWRDDLALTRSLGVRAVRWGVPWYRIEPEPGCFDWTWTDEVMPYIVEALGVIPIVDLVHYGCPEWMPRAFADERYPGAIAAFAGAFAERYAHLHPWYTPVNEPHMTSLMCGWRALWPPYLRGEPGYVRIMLQVARGAVGTIHRLRQVDPSTPIVHVEATALYRSGHADLDGLAAEERERRYLYYDLMHGRVVPGHPLYPWLLRRGARPDQLKAIAELAVPDYIMGLNFYPQWSTHQVYLSRRGNVRQRSIEFDGSGFAELIREHYGRYGNPIMVTETSADGSNDVRSAWLHSSIAAIKTVRGQGVPVIGYTWFPLFTMVDWRYRYGLDPVERYQINLGLYRLRPEHDGLDSRLRWSPTPLADEYRALVEAGTAAVGPLCQPNADPVDYSHTMATFPVRPESNVS